MHSVALNGTEETITHKKIDQRALGEDNDVLGVVDDIRNLLCEEAEVERVQNSTNQC